MRESRSAGRRRRPVVEDGGGEERGCRWWGGKGSPKWLMTTRAGQDNGWDWCRWLRFACAQADAPSGLRPGARLAWPGLPCSRFSTLLSSFSLRWARGSHAAFPCDCCALSAAALHTVRWCGVLLRDRRVLQRSSPWFFSDPPQSWSPGGFMSSVGELSSRCCCGGRDGILSGSGRQAESQPDDAQFAISAPDLRLWPRNRPITDGSMGKPSRPSREPKAARMADCRLQRVWPTPRTTHHSTLWEPDQSGVSQSAAIGRALGVDVALRGLLGSAAL